MEGLRSSAFDNVIDMCVRPRGVGPFAALKTVGGAGLDLGRGGGFASGQQRQVTSRHGACPRTGFGGLGFFLSVGSCWTHVCESLEDRSVLHSLGHYAV